MKTNHCSSFGLTAAQNQHALPSFSLVGTSLAVSENDDDECNAIDVGGGTQRSDRR